LSPYLCGHGSPMEKSIACTRRQTAKTGWKTNPWESTQPHHFYRFQMKAKLNWMIFFKLILWIRCGMEEECIHFNHFFSLHHPASRPDRRQSRQTLKGCRWWWWWFFFFFQFVKEDCGKIIIRKMIKLILWQRLKEAEREKKIYSPFGEGPVWVSAALHCKSILILIDSVVCWLGIFRVCV